MCAEQMQTMWTVHHQHLAPAVLSIPKSSVELLLLNGTSSPPTKNLRAMLMRECFLILVVRAIYELLS